MSHHQESPRPAPYLDHVATWAFLGLCRWRGYDAKVANSTADLDRVQRLREGLGLAQSRRLDRATDVIIVTYKRHIVAAIELHSLAHTGLVLATTGTQLPLHVPSEHTLELGRAVLHDQHRDLDGLALMSLFSMIHLHSGRLGATHWLAATSRRHYLSLRYLNSDIHVLRPIYPDNHTTDVLPLLLRVAASSPWQILVALTRRTLRSNRRRATGDRGVW